VQNPDRRRRSNGARPNRSKRLLTLTEKINEISAHDPRLIRAFLTQYAGLLISSKAFDEGHKNEAIRLANAVFVLLGTGMRNHQSIVSQLYPDLDIVLPSFARGQGNSPLIAARATKVEIDVWEVELVPIAAPAKPASLRLLDWWSEIILRDEFGRDLSRNDLLRAMRDQDGGAHYDARLSNSSYEAALSGDFCGYKYTLAEGKEATILPFSIETTARAIADEVIYALRNTANELSV
jgi:hypothetical protein